MKQQYIGYPILSGYPNVGNNPVLGNGYPIRGKGKSLSKLTLSRRQTTDLLSKLLFCQVLRIDYTQVISFEKSFQIEWGHYI